MRCNFTLFAWYSLKLTRCSLFVVKSPVTRCKICSLLVAEDARCKKITGHSLLKLLVAKTHSLLVADFVSYSLQKLLVAKNHSLLVAEVARRKKLVVTRCEIRPLFVAEVARCKICLLLVGDVAPCKKNTGHSLRGKTGN